MALEASQGRQQAAEQAAQQAQEAAQQLEEEAAQPARWRVKAQVSPPGGLYQSMQLAVQRCFPGRAPRQTDEEDDPDRAYSRVSIPSQAAKPGGGGSIIYETADSFSQEAAAVKVQAMLRGRQTRVKMTTPPSSHFGEKLRL